MKKIFTTLFMASMLLAANANLHLTVNTIDENEETIQHIITKDTTWVVTDYEESIFTGKIEMSIKGDITTASKTINISIVRSAANIKDQFCLGTCKDGNGEVTQEIPLELFNESNTWFAHYYPTTPGEETISYTFNDGVNPTITLTVVYQYSATDVDDVLIPESTKIIFNVLGQAMPTTEFSELPAGIYIIQGKKYIKK